MQNNKRHSLPNSSTLNIIAANGQLTTPQNNAIIPTAAPMVVLVIPISCIPISAKSYIKNPNDASGGSYTNSSALASELDKVFAGDIDVYSDSKCTKEVSMPIGTNMSNSTQYYVKSKVTGKNVSGWQCYIYANAVYNKLFNEWVGHGTSFSHSAVVISGGANTATYEMFKKAGVRCGAYMRTTGSKSGAYDGNVGHSLIILSYDSSYVNYLEGNGDGNGAIRITKTTWSEFNSGQLSGRSRYISHVVQPIDSYYDSLYLDDVQINKLTINYNANGGSIGTTYKVTASLGMKIRTGPGTDYEQIGTYTQDKTFIVTEYKQMSDYTWGKVYYSGQTGWVAIVSDWVTQITSTYSIVSNMIYKNGDNDVFGQVLTYGVELDTGLYNTTTFGLYRKGCNFVGWCASPVGDGTIFDMDQALRPEQIVPDLVNGDRSITLYAIWDGIYSVKFNANGGNNPPLTQEKVRDVALTLPTTIPTKTGYSFLGWSTSVDATVEYQAGATYSANENVTLYAVWRANEYIVSYNANGGTNAPSAQTKVYGTDLTLSATAPSKEGHSFIGWSTSNDSTVEYQAGATYNANENVTLYAVWKADEYTVNYDANGGTNTPSAQTKVHGTDLTLSTTVPTKSGYSFIGWSTSNDSTVEYQAGAMYSANENVTLHAVWKANSYTVYYDANGGDKAPSPQTQNCGDSIVIPWVIPDKTGYEFMGWSEDGSTSSTVYMPSYEYSFESDVILYATWSKRLYRIKYDANGGNNAPEQQTQYYGDFTKIPLDVPVREGYTFEGWSEYGVSTVMYLPGREYSFESNITLYAVWTSNDKEAPSVSFKCDNDIDTSQFLVMYFTDNEKVAGFYFGTNPDYTKNVYASFNLEETNTFHSRTFTEEGVYYLAVKDVNGNVSKTYIVTICKISFDAKGGSVSPSYIIRFGEGTPSRLPKPVRTGYTFKGWSTSNDSTVEYQVGATYSANENVTLYAVWKANEYTVNYDANGGTNAPAKQTKVHGTDLILSATAPSKAGHSFLGWSTSNDSTVEYQVGATYSANENVTLYAVWKANEYTVNYDANGGTNAPAKQTKVHGTDLILSATAPSKAGHSFLGWSTSNDSTVEYQVGATYSANENVTLYAVWKANEYTVNYDANGGTNAPAKQTKVHGTDLILSATAPSKAGHSFLGWSTSNDSTVEYQVGATYSANENVTLYAVWKANEYTVNYDANGGTNAPAKQIKEHGTDLTLSADAPSKAGHSFLGWSTSNDSTVEYQAGATYSANENVTLYAVWKADEYTVNYDANGGTNAPAKQIKVHGTDLTLSATAPSKAGHSFLGWSTSNDSTVEYQAGATYIANADVTLYAVWKADEYTVNYDANGGSNVPPAQTKIYETALTLSDVIPQKTGYTFLGWAVSSDSTTVTYQAGGSYTNNSDVTLYAVWKQNVVIDDSNDDNDSQETTVNKETTADKETTPDKTENANKDTDKKTDSEDKKDNSGCGSSLALSSLALISALGAVGAILSCKKKKED